MFPGLCIFIGIVIYVVNDQQKSAFHTTSYAFFQTVLSSLLAVAGGVVVALDNRATSDFDPVLDYEGVDRGGPVTELQLGRVTSRM